MIRNLATIALVLLLGACVDTAFAMEAQKVMEIKGDSQTLWGFLAKLPLSFEAQVFYGLFISGLCGAFLSWAWKWSQGQSDIAVHHFNPRYLVGQLLWLGGISVTAILTVEFQTASGEFFGWLSVLSTGALSGFSGEVKTKVA